jgi:hypothetical protein
VSPAIGLGDIFLKRSRTYQVVFTYTCVLEALPCRNRGDNRDSAKYPIAPTHHVTLYTFFGLPECPPGYTDSKRDILVPVSVWT